MLSKEENNIGHFADRRGSPDADVQTFWCKKLRIFQNLWRVRTDKRAWASVHKRWGQFFCDFVRASLWTAPILNQRY